MEKKLMSTVWYKYRNNFKFPSNKNQKPSELNRSLSRFWDEMTLNFGAGTSILRMFILKSKED